MTINRMSRVEREAVELLIAAGLAGDELAVASRILVPLRTRDELNRQSPSCWREQCATLDDASVDSLARGLVIAEKLYGWAGGSVAAAIWVYQELERRQPADLEVTTDWLLRKTANTYVPFGTSNFGAKSLPDYMVLATRHSSKIMRGIAEQHTQKDMADVLRRQRAEQRKRAAEERRTALRQDFLMVLSSKPISAQLLQLVDDSLYPVEFHPTCLAYHLTTDVIRSLDEALKGRLLIRLKGKRRGPWAALKKRLRTSCVFRSNPARHSD